MALSVVTATTSCCPSFPNWMFHPSLFFRFMISKHLSITKTSRVIFSLLLLVYVPIFSLFSHSETVKTHFLSNAQMLFIQLSYSCNLSTPEFPQWYHRSFQMVSCTNSSNSSLLTYATMLSCPRSSVSCCDFLGSFQITAGQRRTAKSPSCTKVS